jgi:glycosyl transferase, family 25
LLVRYEKGPRGSQAYALSVDGARRLLDGAEVWCQALDMYLDAFWEHGLPSWAIVPFAARHLPEHQAPSTIGEAKHRRKLTLVAKLRREVTQVRQNFWRYLFNVRQRRRDRRLARALAGVTASAR